MLRNGILIILVLLFSGCWNPFNPERESGESIIGQFETKEAVLETFALAYNTRDIDLYEQCLTDDFVFIFNPLDRSALDSLGLYDESWGKTKEIANTTEIFNNVEGLTFQMTTLSVVDLSSNESEFMFRQNLDLSVTFLDQLVYVYGDALFIVKKVSGDKWKISRIEDLTRG